MAGERVENTNKNQSSPLHPLNFSYASAGCITGTYYYPSYNTISFVILRAELLAITRDDTHGDEEHFGCLAFSHGCRNIHWVQDLFNPVTPSCLSILEPPSLLPERQVSIQLGRLFSSFTLPMSVLDFSFRRQQWRLYIQTRKPTVPFCFVYTFLMFGLLLG